MTCVQVWDKTWEDRDIVGQACVCPVVVTYLPGMAASPAGLRLDAEVPASRLLGHEGKIPHRAAAETTVQLGRDSNAQARIGNNQEEQENRQREGAARQHPGREGEMRMVWGKL